MIWYVPEPCICAAANMQCAPPVQVALPEAQLISCANSFVTPGTYCIPSEGKDDYIPVTIIKP